jgi:hypothetical protein
MLLSSTEAEWKRESPSKPISPEYFLHAIEKVAKGVDVTGFPFIDLLSVAADIAEIAPLDALQRFGVEADPTPGGKRDFHQNSYRLELLFRSSNGKLFHLYIKRNRRSPGTEVEVYIHSVNKKMRKYVTEYVGLRNTVVRSLRIIRGLIGTNYASEGRAIGVGGRPINRRWSM